LTSGVEWIFGVLLKINTDSGDWVVIHCDPMASVENGTDDRPIAIEDKIRRIMRFLVAWTCGERQSMYAKMLQLRQKYLFVEPS